MRGHGAEGVDVDAIAPGRDRQGIEDEAGDRGIRAQEQMAAQDATREEIGGAWEDRTGLAHGRGYDKSHAGIRASDSDGLRAQRGWRRQFRGGGPPGLTGGSKTTDSQRGSGPSAQTTDSQRG